MLKVLGKGTFGKVIAQPFIPSANQFSTSHILLFLSEFCTIFVNFLRCS